MKLSIRDRPKLLGLTRKRLQTLYIVAAAGMAALVPLIFFAGFWIRSELGKTDRDLALFLNARAASISRQVDAEVERQIAAMRALSALPAIDDNIPIFEEAARRVTGIMPHWSSLSLVEADSGSVLFSTAAVSGGTLGQTGLKTAIASRRPSVETRSGTAGRESVVLIHIPVARGDRVKWVLVTVMDASDLQSVVVSQSQDAKLAGSVVDERNRILASSNAPETVLGREAGAAFREATAGQDFGAFNAGSVDGEPVTSAFVRSALTGWIAVASLSQRQSEGLDARSVWATIAAGAVSLALTGILAVFIIHTLMERRVSEERLAASRALSKLDARLLATSQDALAEQRKAAFEREILLREIYHRVKNNLQIVQSLLRLGSRDLKSDQREPFENAVRRIGAMARVHTLLYNSPDLASIDFRDYLDELLRELAEGFAADDRSIAWTLAAEPMRMSLDTAVPLAFIAVEILTNAFKHAFPNGRPGRITVEVQRHDQDAILTIRDDGVGMSQSGPAKRRLGLTIVRKLVQQIGGTLDEPPPGSSVFTISFPLIADATGSSALPPPSQDYPATVQPRAGTSTGPASLREHVAS